MFWRKKLELHRANIDATSSLLERMTDAQAKQVEVFSKFLEVVADLSAKKAASVLGQRSARARKAKKQTPAAQLDRRCPLCVNPLHSPVTVELIQEHNRHAVPAEWTGTDGAGLRASQPADDEHERTQ